MKTNVFLGCVALGLCGVVAAIAVGIILCSQREEPDAVNIDVRQRGRDRMRKEKVVFCGIARDNAEHLDKTLALIERMGEMFASYKVIVYENDSSDATLSMLKAWRDKLGEQTVTVLHEHLEWPPAIADGGFSKRRFQILSYCRNQYVARLKCPEYADSKYAVVLDMDLWDFDVDGLAHSFGVGGGGGDVVEWSSISANGVFDGRTYYDALAFRSDEFPDTLNSEKQRYDAQLVYSVNDPLVPVKSAFGGLAIYKRSCLVQCAYTGDDCEHVGMYACQTSLGHECDAHFMNPAMLLRYHL